MIARLLRSRTSGWKSIAESWLRAGLGPGARRRRELAGWGRLGSRHPGSRVGVVLVQRLVLEQRAREPVEPLPITGQEGDNLVVCRRDNAAHLLVDESLGLRRDLGDTWKERPGAITRDDGDGAERVAHAPAPDHLACEPGQLLDVGLGAGADLAEDELLGHPATEGDLDLREYLGLLVVEAIGVGG